MKDYTDANGQAGLKDEGIFKAIKDGVKDENGKDVLRCTATFLMFPDKKGSE